MDAHPGQLFDDARNSRWSRLLPFQAGGSGLVSTADDYLAFFRMMLNKGLHGRERILSAIEAHDVHGAAVAMGKHIERLLGDIAEIKDINPEFFDERV